MGEVTYVKRGNDYFVRRKRGSVTKAGINETLQLFVKRNKVVMHTATQVNDIMKEYAGHFKEGAFWQRLLSRLKKCKDDNPQTHLQSLAKLELNERHALLKHVSITPYSIKVYKDHFTLNLKFDRHASFRNKKNNCYYYEVIALLWDNKPDITEHHSIPTRWIYYSHEVPEYELNFKRTKWDKYYLLVVNLIGGHDGITQRGMADRAMMILGGGKLD